MSEEHLKLQAGDILFLCGTSSLSKLIKKVTFGPASHVGILYDQNTIFETDGSYGKAEFHSLEKYIGKPIELYRYKFSTPESRNHIKALCEEYEGSPYSYWDITIKGLFFWLHPKLRGKISKTLGTKKFMICNELVMRILYDAYKLDLMSNYESSNPTELLGVMKAYPNLFERLL